MNTETRTIRSARSTLLAVVILTTLTVSTAGCRSPQEGSFAGISPGMSQEQVIDVLGPPSSRLHAADDRPESPWSVRWHWGDTLGTLATTAAMPDQPPPNRVWTVWFDSDGRVLRAASPIVSHGQDDAPWLPPSIPPR
ncbi:MAG: outer membrane protein assembly factor BamE [Planctomycetes bacterium]|nr:outer membrane protein assembly factor BamE [Planctomycetota bacterium]MCP4839190.1 outer membrane protein assembly factor BamE [Planctomycetota bacterium]